MCTVPATRLSVGDRRNTVGAVTHAPRQRPRGATLAFARRVAGPRALCRRCAHCDDDPVRCPVVDERERASGLENAIQRDLRRPLFPRTVRHLFDPDRVGGAEVTVAQIGTPATKAGKGVSGVFPPSRVRPRSDSTISRYIQPAEPVYQVQPPRPTCGGTA